MTKNTELEEFDVDTKRLIKQLAKRTCMRGNKWKDVVQALRTETYIYALELNDGNTHAASRQIGLHFNAIRQYFEIKNGSRDIRKKYYES